MAVRTGASRLSFGCLFSVHAVVSNMASAPVENPVVLHLMATQGPILIGAILSCVLYGMACIQL